MKFENSSGILLAITALDGEYGIGTMGDEARHWIDFLAGSGQKLWQILPHGPTGYGDSPYQTFSAFAGNILWIDMQLIQEMGLLTQSEIDELRSDNKKVDYGRLVPIKNRLMKKAYTKFVPTRVYHTWLSENMAWLADYGQFMAIKEARGGGSWQAWEMPIRKREAVALAKICEDLASEIAYHYFVQYIFFLQWNALHTYANNKGIKIIGDIPIFVAADSADAWANSEMFCFDDQMLPIKVAGVPPDAFSADGQLWGNPVYDWQYIQKNNFSWWCERVKFMAQLVDIVRIDHFRGFVGTWTVDYGQPTAREGRWEDVPGIQLFETIKKELGDVAIIAEDLGVMTDAVEQLRDTNEFPGMKVLQFAFYGGSDNPFLPENFPANSVVYTGTHDNETTQGWWKNQDGQIKDYVKYYLGITSGADIAWDFIRLAWQSHADIVIAPWQDFLALGNVARFNSPGSMAGNWQWRMDANQLTDVLKEKIKNLTISCQR